MGTPEDTTARALLGELLKIARQDSQYKTQAELARAVGLERTGITRAEGGEHPPTLQVLNDILARTGPHSRLCEAAVRGVWRLAKREGDADEPVRLWFSGYLPIEAAATAIRTWHTTIIPGLLQTEQYSAALFRAMGMSPDELAAQVELRP